MATQRQILKRVAAIRRVAADDIMAAQSRTIAEVVRASLELTLRVEALAKVAATRGDAERLLNGIDLLLAGTTADIHGALLGGTDSVFDIALTAGADQAAMWNTISPRQLLALSTNFDATFRPDLRTHAYNSWIQRIPRETLAPEMALRKSLEDLVAGGKDLRSVARSFVEQSQASRTFETGAKFMRSDVQLMNLPVIEQKIAPLARAMRVMRTELGRIDNTVSITFSESAGLDTFINLGVGDERQSEICAAATAQDPMTLEEWRKSEYGIAPRHPYCRCAMVGVPAEVNTTLTQPQLADAGALNQEALAA